MRFFSFNALTSPSPTPKALVFLFLPIRTADNNNLMLSSRFQIIPKSPPFYFHSSPLFLHAPFHLFSHSFFNIQSHVPKTSSRWIRPNIVSRRRRCLHQIPYTDDINRVKDLMALLLLLRLVLKEVHLLRSRSPHEKIALLESGDQFLYFNREQISDNIRYFLHFF